MQVKVIMLSAMLLLWSQMGFAQTDPQTAEGVVDRDIVAAIGVLAYRGEDQARAEWQGLATYLTQTVTGTTFEITPVTLASVNRAITDEQIDFLITNPGHFVTLSARHDLSALATRERWAASAL